MLNAIGTNEIGAAFDEELSSAGLFGLPFSWRTDGVLTFGAAITDEQKTAILVVLAAHNPLAPTWREKRNAARAALDASDIVIIRCYEAGIPTPQEWRSYRAGLRAIVSAASGNASSSLPARPDYPAGT